MTEEEQEAADDKVFEETKKFGRGFLDGCLMAGVPMIALLVIPLTVLL